MSLLSIKKTQGYVWLMLENMPVDKLNLLGRFFGKLI